jgi:hypothetical protein
MIASSSSPHRIAPLESLYDVDHYARMTNKGFVVLFFKKERASF